MTFTTSYLMVKRNNPGRTWTCSECGHELTYPTSELPEKETKAYIRFLKNSSSIGSFIAKISRFWESTTSIELKLCKTCGSIILIPRQWKRSSAKSTFGD